MFCRAPETNRAAPDNYGLSILGLQLDGEDAAQWPLSAVNLHSHTAPQGWLESPWEEGYGNNPFRGIESKNGLAGTASKLLPCSFQLSTPHGHQTVAPGAMSICCLKPSRNGDCSTALRCLSQALTSFWGGNCFLCLT